MGTKHSKKPNIKQFDTRNTTWKQSGDYDTTSRLLTSDMYQEVKIDENCACAPKKVKNCPVRVKKRIGSESKHGEVYKVSISKPSITLAAKIMHINSPESIRENLNEMKITEMASNLVTEGKSEHFPILYETFHCSDTLYTDSRNDMALDTVYYHYMKNIKVPEKVKREISRTFSESKKQNIKKLRKIIIRTVKEYNGTDMTKILQEIKIPSNIMFMEIAWGDLKNYMEKGAKISEENLFNILIGVLTAISHLQSINVVHGDLHIANVLLIKQDKEFIPLIFDFGKSFIVDKWTNNERIEDVMNFTWVLRRFTENNPKLVNVDKCLKELRRKYGKYRDTKDIIPDIIQFVLNCRK